MNPAILKRAVKTELRPWHVAVLFAAVLIALYPGVLFGATTFYYRDFGIFGYPLAFYHKQSFWNGEWPLWNPLNNAGVPFLAQWNTMTLYPGALLYLLLPLAWSLGVFCLAHMAWGAWGMYALVRRWTSSQLAGAAAGLIFGFNGLTWHALMWPNNMAALGWMPWVIGLAERARREGGSRWYAAAAAASLQMLTGAPEIILMTWMVVGGLALAAWRGGADPGVGPARSGLRLAGLAAFVAWMCAAQLLPFLQLLGDSQRDVNYGQAGWAMPGTGWANFLLPAFRTFQSFLGVHVQSGQYWTTSYYLGAGALGLAVMGWWWRRDARSWTLAGLGGLGAILALGGSGYVYDWLVDWVPALGFMRFPIKFVVLPACVIPMLAGLAVARLESAEWGTDARRALERSAGAMVAVLAALILGLMAFAWWYPASGEVRTFTVGQGVVRLVFVALLWLWVSGRAQRVAWHWAGPAVLLGVLWLDVRTHAADLNPTVPRYVYAAGLARDHWDWQAPETEGAARMLVSGDSLRAMRRTAMPTAEQDFLGRRLALFGNCNLLDGVSKLNGFYALYPSASDDMSALLYDGAASPPEGLLNWLGVTWVTPAGEVIGWEKREGALPLVTAGQAPRAARKEDLEPMLLDAGLDLTRTVLLEAPLDERAAEIAGGGVHVLDWRRANHEWLIKVRADRPGVVVVAQTHYPAWHAYVDGRSAPIWRANMAYQAIPVPKGTSEIRLAYEDRRFQAGLWLSLAGWTAGLAGWLRARTRERREGGIDALDVLGTKVS